MLGLVIVVVAGLGWFCGQNVVVFAGRFCFWVTFVDSVSVCNGFRVSYEFAGCWRVV